MLGKASTTQELIPLSAPGRWQAALQDVPYAFGHTWESCYAMQLTTGYRTYLYVWQRGLAKVVCPLAERLCQGFTDVTTPYGFSGFVGTATFADFMNDWYRFAAQAGYVCGYIGLNPILSPATDMDVAAAFVSNKLYVIPLQPTIQEIYNKLSQNRKRQLKQVEKHRFRYYSEKPQLKEFFLAQYHAFFAQKGAADTYQFSLATLAHLVDSERVILIGYTEANEVRAVAMFAYTEYMAEYLFSISVPGYENHTTPLLWHGILRLKEQQVPYLNLGGGAQPGDSIASFKQRFGALELPLSSLKQVYQQEPYAALCQQGGIDPLDKQGYFPPYRLPGALLDY
jgi:hypothetical protein